VVQWYIGDSLKKNGHGKGKSDEIHFAEMEHPMKIAGNGGNPW